jgi:hypothetical protein
MLASERLAEIELLCARSVERMVPLELDGETLRLVIYMADGTNLRVAEQWDGTLLVHYSYYWLTADNRLKIGWDNAPHHTRLSTLPHHQHVGQRQNLQPSSAKRLEDVLAFILDAS